MAAAVELGSFDYGNDQKSHEDLEGQGQTSLKWFASPLLPMT